MNIDITFDENIFTNPSVNCGSSSQQAGKVCQGNLISPGNYRIIIYGGTSVINNGAVVILTLQAISTVSPQDTTIYCSGSASDPNGSSVNITSCQSCIVNIKAPPLNCTAEANPEEGNVPLTVNFTSSAGGGVQPYSFLWDFGDGSSSTQQNISHTYTREGIYIWKLTIKDSLNQKCQRNGRIYAAMPECQAEAEPEEGSAPLEVNFTSEGSGGTPPYNLHWEFGDGESSNEQNTKHTYKNPGTYNWQLTLTDSATQTCQKTGSILVKEEESYFYFIPASANSKGGYNTNWKTDAVFYNKGNQTANITLYFLEAGKDNSGAEGKEIKINSGQSLRINDIVGNFFGKENTSGGIMIKSNQNLLISSRTYNETEEGTYGQYISGKIIDEALKENEEALIIQITKNKKYRANIGFLNCGSENIEVQIDIYKSNRDEIGSKKINLLPFEYKQENNIIEEFTEEDIEDAFAIIKSTKEGAIYFAYASIVDNRTGDAIFVPANSLVNFY